MSITIGADPEVFVKSPEGTIIPVTGLLGGNKDYPRQVSYGALQEDNVLAEFNIDPAHTLQEFRNHIGEVLGEMKIRLFPNTFEIKASHYFDQDVLNSCGDKALEFGCDPDLNAWYYSVNDSPKSGGTLRTAGGHVHIGYDDSDPMVSFDIVKMCDIFMGIPSVVLDTDTVRRSMYGAAGACRLKEYGVEYRSLSNFWIKSPKLQEWVYNQAHYCVNKVSTLTDILDCIGEDLVQSVINEGDVKEALKLVEYLNISMPEV